jgi:predicted AlkP superfamily phosphohydrolase/phosphomutase
MPEAGGRVFLLVLDSLDDELTARGIDEGWMPNLAKLIPAGTCVRIRDAQATVPGSLWGTWTTGTTYDLHGIVAALQLRPGTYEVDPTAPEIARRQPFWRHLSDAGIPSTVLSLPAAVLPDFLGTQVSAWGASTQYAVNQRVQASPPEAGRWLEELGPRRVTMEGWIDSMSDFDRNLDRALDEIRVQTRGIVLMLDRTDWRFFASAFTQAHQMGHYLWHFHDPAHPRHDPDAPEKLRNCIRLTYEHLDAAVGEIVAHLPDDTTILLLSQEGMASNTILHDPMAQMLEAGGHLARSAGVPEGPGGSRAWALRSGRALARKVLPAGVRARISRRLPTDRWWREIMLRDIDWTRSSAFALPADVSSFARVNLATREPQGIVQPGEPYDRLLERLEREIRSFVDDETGDPVADQVVQVERSTGHPVEGGLPDLLVAWNMRPPFRRLRSASLGVVEIAQDDVRSGQHRPVGWMVGTGGGVPSSGSAELRGPSTSLLDVAPTVLSTLGVTPPPELSGRSIRWDA